MIGELQRARDLMERLLHNASPLGLYAEELDAATGRHLGNFPQAFSHLALIEAAARIIVAERIEEYCAMSHYDVIVIGSGAGGGTLVHRLAPSGKRVLLLERGDWLPREPAELVGRGRVRRQPLRLAPRPGTTSTASAFQPQIHYFVGGATKLYGAALYRLREEDFGELRAPRRQLARVAGRLRRVRALLHAGRAALPGARRARGGPDRAARERAVPAPGSRSGPR